MTRPSSLARLGVNIDHVATLRNARRTRYPNPIAAAALVEKAGADQITVHLREDRRHIRDEDIRELRRSVSIAFNLEMSISPQIVAMACEVKPDTATLVPEKREELTTEGGLNVTGLKKDLEPVIQQLKKLGIEVSLFIEPEKNQIDGAVVLGADRVEFHTGQFAERSGGQEITQEIRRLQMAVIYAKEKGLFVAAGHGLNYDNIEHLLREIPAIEEYNIGHSVVSRALFVGLEEAVKEMKALLAGGYQ